ncbi:MAG TPA: hypothetical protein VLK33_07160, partial [Terriglobales bacterium]|nr:hypothetical protein [Terriglobales bacterium]
QLSSSDWPLADIVDSLPGTRSNFDKDPVPMKTGNEFLDVMLDYRAICLKLPTDLVDDDRFCRSAFEEFEDA